jgi:tetratricopeptide (TPR) repeat protein
VLGDPRVIDTVRFARTTLLIRAGDCDDTTALLGSLLESSGIGTAIMTSPGHVFLAFDTGEPVGNAWMYRTRQLEILEHGGTVWIPVETTVLQDGFVTAWLEASELIRKYDRKREIEFLPVELQQQAYPPLPLPVSGFLVVEPPQEEINSLYAASLDDLIEDVHGEISGNLLDEAASSDGRARLAALNRTGILHARFGKDNDSARVFLESIHVEPDYIPPYVNLAQLKLLQEDIDGALKILRMAERRELESAQVHLLFARCYSHRGDDGLAARHLKKIEKISPSLARRYQYLLKNGETGVHSSGQRAGITDTRIIWYTEE